LEAAGPGEPPLRPPEPLRTGVETSAFDCGQPTLNEWLRHWATRSEGRTARTYVSCSGARVAGFYCLAAASASRGTLPTRLERNSPKHIPLVVLGRLAVDLAFQRRGLGKALLHDALVRTSQAASAIGVRGLVVHAIDEDAARFYGQFGFVPCPIGERTLILPIEIVGAAHPG
jgi:GNAT superfamily N-acetyltransferase